MRQYVVYVETLIKRRAHLECISWVWVACSWPVWYLWMVWHVAKCDVTWWWGLDGVDTQNKMMSWKQESRNEWKMIYSSSQISDAIAENYFDLAVCRITVQDCKYTFTLHLFTICWHYQECWNGDIIRHIIMACDGVLEHPTYVSPENSIQSSSL